MKNRFLLVKIDTRDLENIRVKPVGIFFDCSMAEEIEYRENVSDDEDGIHHAILTI